MSDSRARERWLSWAVVQGRRWHLADLARAEAVEGALRARREAVRGRGGDGDDAHTRKLDALRRPSRAVVAERTVGRAAPAPERPARRGHERVVPRGDGAYCSCRCTVGLSGAALFAAQPPDRSRLARRPCIRLGTQPEPALLRQAPRPQYALTARGACVVLARRQDLNAHAA